MLLLARCLVGEQRYDEALAIYDRLDMQVARVGKATVLLQLDRVGEALAIASAAVAEGESLDALEVHARALERAGRFHDAQAAFRRFVAAAGASAHVRVRLARRAIARLGATVG